MQQQQQLGLPRACVTPGRQHAAFCRATDGSDSDDDPPSPRCAPAAASPDAVAPPSTPEAAAPPPSAARRPVVPLEQLEEALICPITQLRLEDPVVAADGHTYERQAIERARRRRSPPARRQLAASSLSRAASRPPPSLYACVEGLQNGDRDAPSYMGDAIKDATLTPHNPSRRLPGPRRHHLPPHP